MQAESLEVLEKADVAPAQARAIVRAIEIEIAGAKDTLATKHDLLLQTQDTHQQTDNVRREVTELGATLRGEMAQLRAEVRTEMAGLRTDMAEWRDRLLVRLRSRLRAILGYGDRRVSA
jgi:FtsZ-binding cell division protein ZapB